MANLSEDERRQVWAELMRELGRREVRGISRTKFELLAMVGAADDAIESGKVSAENVEAAEAAAVKASLADVVPGRAVKAEADFTHFRIDGKILPKDELARQKVPAEKIAAFVQQARADEDAADEILHKMLVASVAAKRAEKKPLDPEPAEPAEGVIDGQR